jgi:hypothetical protein
LARVRMLEPDTQFCFQLPDLNSLFILYWLTSPIY